MDGARFIARGSATPVEGWKEFEVYSGEKDLFLLVPGMFPNYGHALGNART